MLITHQFSYQFNVSIEKLSRHRAPCYYMKPYYFIGSFSDFVYGVVVAACVCFFLDFFYWLSLHLNSIICNFLFIFYWLIVWCVLFFTLHLIVEHSLVEVCIFRRYGCVMWAIILELLFCFFLFQIQFQ